MQNLVVQMRYMLSLIHIYYNEQKYYAWFKFDKIEECEADEVKNYTYVNVDSLFVENHSNYEKFYGKRVYNIKEMIQQNRTIWFVRNYNENDDSDYEIQLLNSSVVEPHDFSDKYFETGSDTLLWLSDLHFGTDDVFKVKMAKETDVTLTAHIRNAYNDLNKVGGLIITGDTVSYTHLTPLSNGKQGKGCYKGNAFGTALGYRRKLC